MNVSKELASLLSFIKLNKRNAPIITRVFDPENNRIISPINVIVETKNSVKENAPLFLRIASIVTSINRIDEDTIEKYLRI
jgi:hypothetical protein